MKLYILLFIYFLFSGCTTVETGTKFELLAGEPKDKATLYIYRPKTNFNWGGYPNIYIDNEQKASLANNSYFIAYVMPGEHIIKAEGSTWGTNWYPGPVERKFNFNADSSYYLRVRPIQTGSTKVQNTLTESALTNAIIGAAIESAISNLPNWPTSITLMEMVEIGIGKVEIQETYQIKQLK